MREQIPPSVALHQLAAGHWVSQAPGVAAELGVADHMAAAPRDVSELAKAVSAHPGALARLMRALASVDCRRILATCRAAMPSFAKLLLVQMVIPLGNDPFFGKLLDLASG